MKKIRIAFLILLFIQINTARAFAWTHQRQVYFMNCTNQEVRVENPYRPYKFSLDNASPATNGYSNPVSFTVPKEPLLYKSPQDLTYYLNSFIDGGMTLILSGGIAGSLDLKQIIPPKRTHARITANSSNPDILVFPTIWVASPLRYSGPEEQTFFIILGCSH